MTTMTFNRSYFPKIGKVSLVGAGPGDPELLTIKALKAIQAASVLLVDDLVSEECEMNDGEIREIGEEFPSGAIESPQHVNCRCSMAPSVGDAEE